MARTMEEKLKSQASKGERETNTKGLLSVDYTSYMVTVTMVPPASRIYKLTADTRTIRCGTLKNFIDSSETTNPTWPKCTRIRN